MIKKSQNPVGTFYPEYAVLPNYTKKFMSDQEYSVKKIIKEKMVHGLGQLKVSLIPDPSLAQNLLMTVIRSEAFI
jgi:hypothetical protein